MGNIRRLSVNDLRRVAGVSDKQYKKIDWHGSQLIMKKLLTMEEFAETVDKIIGWCSDDGNGSAAQFLDFAIRVNTISSYAFVDLPADADELYYIIYASDLYETICKYANKDQIEAIRNTVLLFFRGD